MAGYDWNKTSFLQYDYLTETDRVGGLRNGGQLPTIVRFVDGPRQSELLEKRENLVSIQYVVCFLMKWYTVLYERRIYTRSYS